ncbi:MFS transporter [Stappia sp.]|uniref:MFS transporter n=1 Tax=Stappia sp. TaxID=1870903 RepID=UPI003A99D541
MSSPMPPSAMDRPVPPAARSGQSRQTLLAFTLTLATIYAAAGAPTPIYRIYQELWQVSPVLISLIFAVYAFSLLAALLIAGSLSDHLGRRPLVLAALAVQICAMSTFLIADGPYWLLAARILQGVGTGLAASSLGAAIVDVDETNGPTINSLAPMIGMGLGSLVSGALVSFAPAPTLLVYALILSLNALQAVLVWRTRETVIRRPGALAALDPRISVPPAARRTLLHITPFNASLWTLGGFFMSMIPSVVAQTTGIETPFLGGLMASMLMLSAASAVFTQRGRCIARLADIGAAGISLGVITLVAGVVLGEIAALVAGTLLAGFGMGASFSSSTRALLPLAAPEERAELLAAFYVECYLAFSLPAIAAGFLVRNLGFVATAEIFGAVVLALNLSGYLLLRRSHAFARPSLCPAG